MKYVFVVVIAVLILGGVFFMFGIDKKSEQEAAVVPQGFHMMEDGTLMENAPIDDSMEQEGEGAADADLSLEAQTGITLDPNAQVFSVKGINYGYDVKEIRVKEGDTVTINFESTDGFHDWVVDEFNAKTNKVQPGTLTSVTFVADKKGTFEYYCSVGSHRLHGMVGNLIVE